jgi:hypothetical protein
VTKHLRISLLAVAAGFALVAGCNRSNDSDTIQSYAAPKESQPPVAAANEQAPADQPGETASAQPAAAPIEWKVPAGWKQLPGSSEMRFATFQVADDPQAVLTVVALGMSARAVHPNVQRWAGQLKLPDVSQADLPKYVTQTQVSGEQADLVDMTGAAESGKEPTRLLAAIIPHDDRVWFLTLKGPEPVIATQKSNFEQFVHSIQFPAGPAPSTASPAAPSATGERFRLSQWKAPEGWQEQPGSNAMRVTSFRVGSGEQTAEVIVSRIPQGQSGSLVDNVNRWRGQVGLGPVASAKEAGFQFIPVAGHEGMFLSYTGSKTGAAPGKQLLVAMTIQGTDDWYIKMLGPEPVVSAQIDAFKQFVSSLQFTPESK